MTSTMKKIAFVCLGYVGLSLVVEFGNNRPMIDFDINAARIDKLCAVKRWVLLDGCLPRRLLMCISLLINICRFTRS